MFFWMYLTLKMGAVVGCPKKSNRNYHSTMPNSSEKQRSHDDVAMQAMVRFRAIWFGAVRLALHMGI